MSYDSWKVGFGILGEDMPQVCEDCGKEAELTEYDFPNPFKNGIPDGTLWLCKPCAIERGYVEEEED